MKKKILGILICMLLIATAVPAVSSLTNQTNTTNINQGEKLSINPPSKPTDATPWHDHPNDKNKGLGGQNKQYTYTTTSSNTGDIYYKFYWGDGTESGWIGPYQSGQIVSATHIYSVGVFSITAVAKVGTEVSDPSPARTVNMLLLCDCNFDGVFDYDDIDLFVWMIELSMDPWQGGKQEYYMYYPYGYWYLADANLDNDVYIQDINAFHALLNNHPPATPSTPSGPTKGIVGKSYTYSTVTTDPDAPRNDKVRYGWDWNGDETIDLWTVFFNSGVIVNTAHSWSTAGIYNIQVIAEDYAGGFSDWSTQLQVCLYLLGDINGDGVVNIGDINPFVLALSAGEAGYYVQYPDGYYYTADINQDGMVDFGDINPFVALLSGR